MRLYFLTLSLFICAGILAPAPAQAADIVGFFFPSLKKKEYDPYETLQAPFAQTSEDQTGKPLHAQIPLDKPHRTTSDIREWLVTAISEAMSFEAGQYEEKIEYTRSKFDDIAYKEYLSFLEENNLKKIVKSGKYNINSFVELPPNIRNKGVIQERYRWAFEVPIMASYIDKGNKNYKDGKTLNQKITLTIHIGRIETQNSDDIGLVIEGWSGKFSKIKAVGE